MGSTAGGVGNMLHCVGQWKTKCCGVRIRSTAGRCAHVPVHVHACTCTCTCTPNTTRWASGDDERAACHRTMSRKRTSILDRGN
mmetsp:Transcript_41117/g.45835  ORF Transcript_41117/g.45835 Transcript_41117/m.45835 type:complete len:84 (-) Transcript_41117:207-458(-)